MSAALLDEFLSRIEREELRSLTWGYVDGSLSVDQLRTLFEEVNGAPDGFEAVLAEMADRLLVAKNWVAGKESYRSRFGETVRLLVRLRQVTHTKPWDVAPDLVSDFRVTTGPRRVPKRSLDVDAVLAQWRGASRWDPSNEPAVEAFLDTPAARLSQFQVDVGLQVFEATGRDSGLVVTAGTGAGKTLAYYLPIAIELAKLVATNDYWTKSISLYPRTELLKDQMSDVFAITSKIPTRAGSSRPLRLGALFGPVPESPGDVAKAWRRGKRGYVCPFLRCPRCDGELQWPEIDLSKGRERLTCIRCEEMVGQAGEVALTRQSLLTSPPDLLFVSAEMVNQRLSHQKYRELLGVHRVRERRARYLLLDEIHTYTGITGAQVGGVVRRYRHAIAGPLFVVGLSATLRDAPEFLANLTGIAPQACREIEPSEDDLESKSAIHQVVLRANSQNRTSVLSTTIQTAFLLSRTLDSSRAKVESGGRFGTREFVFLDTLDVTNRLFDDLRDAEGVLYGSAKPPLASLRPPLKPGEPSQRDLEGQAWHMADKLTGSLNNPLRISRTSSQDVGVDEGSDVVIATPSLEVGFNDPRVGAVIQHRAPRDLATFVQRRGRAGRPISMRPWMVTVLSEFGRDRLAFQLYEQLFDPVLPPRHLPTRNRYVLRIQATYSLLDWLALRLQESGPMWAALSGPSTFAGQKRTRERVLELLDELMKGDAQLEGSLVRHLRGALQVDDREASALLWLPPRGLLAEAVPTLRRRLATEWRTHDGGLDLQEGWHPLPDFVPRALFQDLLLPEVHVQVPDGGRAEDIETRVPVAQALREFAPGRVSRRLAVHNPRLSHWVEPKPIVSIPEWMPKVEALGELELGGERVPLVRPLAVATVEVPGSVSKTSYGALEWRSKLEPVAEGIPLGLPRGTPVSSTFEVLDFHLHARRNPITVTRFALDGSATVTNRSGATQLVRTKFEDGNGKRVAVGFSQEVDGLRASVSVPGDAELFAALGGPWAAPWRTALLRRRISDDSELQDQANPFELAWLADAVLLAVIRAALQGDPDSAIERSLADLWEALREAVQVMSRAGAGPEVEELSKDEDEATDRLSERLQALIDDPKVLAALQAHLRVVVSPTQEDIAAWARSQFMASAAGALLAAAGAMLPNRAGAEALVVDVLDDDRQGEVWVTETTLGGGGVIEAIAEGFAADPWRFVRALEGVIGLSADELLSDALRRTVELLAEDAATKSLSSSCRTARTHQDRIASLKSLSSRLTSQGISVDQSLLVALNQRVLRPGSDDRLDAALLELDAARRRVAAGTGLWPELRLFAMAASSVEDFLDDFRRLLAEWRGGNPADEAAVGAAISASLWPSTEDVRPLGLEFYNPFSVVGAADPEWIRRFLPTYGIPVDLASPSWEEEMNQRLLGEGSALLTASAADTPALRDAIHRLVATPIPMGSLVVYPALAALRSENAALVARFEVRELG